MIERVGRDREGARVWLDRVVAAARQQVASECEQRNTLELPFKRAVARAT